MFNVSHVPGTGPGALLVLDQSQIIKKSSPRSAKEALKAIDEKLHCRGKLCNTAKLRIKLVFLPSGLLTGQ